MITFKRSHSPISGIFSVRGVFFRQNLLHLCVRQSCKTLPVRLCFTVNNACSCVKSYSKPTEKFGNLPLDLPLFKPRPQLREIYRIRRAVRRAKKISQREGNLHTSLYMRTLALVNFIEKKFHGYVITLRFRKATYPFEVYGDRHTNTELIRLVYGILDQLIPTLKRDLYECVDGQKANLLDPEESPLLPHSVKMHREANTTEKDRVKIKNHFDRTDFDDMLSDIDLDLKYSNIAVIKKSNGMVSESHMHFYKRLNFGEPVDNVGFKVTNMQVTVESHAWVIESNFLGYEETKTVDLHFFVKLVISKTNVTFSAVNNIEKITQVEQNAVYNSSSASFDTSSHGQHHVLTGNFSSTPLKRSRRAANVVPWNEAGRLSLNIERSFTLFEKRVIGIYIKGVGKIWLKDGEPAEIGVGFDLFIGGRRVGSRNLFTKQYKGNQLEDGNDLREEYRLPLPGIVSNC